jgi:hypothetical protein
LVKKFVVSIVVVFSLLGAYSAFAAGQQLVVDYQNFKKIVLWVAQKQALEEQQRQRQQQQAAKPIAPAPAPAAPAEPPK